MKGGACWAPPFAANSCVVFLDILDGVFLQAGNLRLADADFLGNFHLRFSFKIPQANDIFFAFSQFADGIAQGNARKPVFGGVFFVRKAI